MMDDISTLPVAIDPRPARVSTVAQLAAIPKEGWAARRDQSTVGGAPAGLPRRPGHGADIEGPRFRSLEHNGTRQEERRRIDPDAIDRVVRKYAAALGCDRGYSAHSMRATFISTALKNGDQLEDVRKAASHPDPSTTKLYDRRGYNPEKTGSFFATY